MALAPYTITTLALPERPGVIGLAPVPGRVDLDADIATIRAWGAVTVVTLQPQDELEWLGIGRLGAMMVAAGLEWHHLPIFDLRAPDDAFERVWESVAPTLLERLERGERILIHCRGGFGRTGTVAARLLVARGLDPEAAIALVRHTRPGSIETDDQERHVLALSRLALSRLA
ncbi:MAG: dual specificity protein phosphatase family protein [Alphaproteobacteria bacterium]|nr:dual specificity protein phosphatase family protein [Alphaproteobacteria bacterium]